MQLMATGTRQGPRRLKHIFGLFDIWASADREDYKLFTYEGTRCVSDPRAEEALTHPIRSIFENLTGDVSVFMAAPIARMSGAAFLRHLKRASGQNFNAMVRKLRLSHASQLLEQASAPPARIAQDVGYGIVLNFSRRFLAYSGMTRTSYRAQNFT